MGISRIIAAACLVMSCHSPAFAADTVKTNPWAADLYQRARTRGHDHPHTVRILARAWLFIIWHCWQDNVPYQPANHRALQQFLTPKPEAA